MVRFGPIAWIRKAWRRLISMRTALVLLFLLALAAVPGSLLPQRVLNPTRTQNYIASHGAWGRLLDRLDAFAVFSSPWFAAIYLLLFVSLVGCIVPRVRVHLRALRAKPLPAPRNLARLPESGDFDVHDERAPAELAAQLPAALGRRWRTVVRDEPTGAVTVSAEKGYSRETGNVLFHICLVAVLVCVAIGHMFSYQGTIVVTQGRGFCNTVLSYDAFTSGPLASSGQVAPFCVTSVDKFIANYQADGQASEFEAQITYQRTVTSPEEHYDLRVNKPLRLEGDRLYLLSHGFSAQLTVTRPDGDTRTVTSALVPQDANLTSEGAFKLQYGTPDPSTGKHTDDIGIEALLAPTAVDNGGVISSTSPQLTDPILAAIAYTGDLGLSNGVPQSVYSLDPTAKADGDLKEVASQNMAIGQTMTLPDGTTVKFDQVLPWVSLQVSHDPTQKYLLIAVVLLVLGLILSLGVRRRRLWIRISPAKPTGEARGETDDPTRAAEAGGSAPRPPGADPPPRAGADPDAPLSSFPAPPRTVITVGGLARSDAGSFPDEFASLLKRLRQQVSAPEAAKE
jgi:cytochrome c biogenesis protein